MTGPMQRAVTAWGTPLPDWIEALAQACQDSSQQKVAARLGRSGAVVSGVLGRRYAGDMAAIEDRVRGALMRSTVDCPALGDLPTNACADWRERSRNFSGHNALWVRMYRACLRCPRNAAKGEGS